MPNIFYRAGKNGEEYGTWPGVSVREDGKVVKKGQLYLGRVISKEQYIFFSKEEGYFWFNIQDQTIHGLSKDHIAIQDGGLSIEGITGITTVRFGGSYFFGRLIPGIEYNEVLYAIECNHERLLSLIHYYLLTDTADMHTGKWYEKSFTKYLYPVANLYSQRISDLYEQIGRDDATRVVFLEKHIEYVLGSTDDECCIIIDSSGCQNVCKVPFTRVSRHESEINLEFRVIVVVQRSTGLPLYYEIIQGNVVDSSTIDSVKRKMANLGLKVTDVLADAGYSCPGNLERLILSGVDFTMRLNPTYNLYKSVVNKNLSRLTDRKDPDVKRVVYRNRHVCVLKLSAVIGEDKEMDEEKKGYIFLCMDVEAHMQKTARLYEHNKDLKKPLTEEQLQEAESKLGVFAIVETRDISEEDVLPEYYMRQSVEQFFDCAKNYGRMMPVRNHNDKTIRGHMMLSFITTFLCVLVKNRMNLMDSPYCAVPSTLQKKLLSEEGASTGDTLPVKTENGEEMILIQDPLLEIFDASPGVLFRELEYVNAIYFPERKEIGRLEQLVPDIAHKDAKNFFQAFGLLFPLTIEIQKGGTLIYHYSKEEKETCSKALAFTRRPSAEEKVIEQARKMKEKEEAEAEKAKAAAEEKRKAEEAEKAKKTSTEPKRGAGRPKGSLNKKTIAKLEEQKRLEEQGLIQPQVKRGRGRPKGSRNKKTLEKEAKQNQANADQSL